MKRYLIVGFILMVLLISGCQEVKKTGGAESTPTPEPTAKPPKRIKCGNGAIDPGEECDGSNLNEQTCVSLGYIGGNLSCIPPKNPKECKFNESECTIIPTPPPTATPTPAPTST